ncbi:MAG TPA: NAD(P)H-binding protein [Actinomycetales bacterium]|nr:NAD(P)H-binding protein [Actinomycetales bacterium]
MKITIIGATGMVGGRVVTEALRRGHDVTAVSRSAATQTGHSDASWVSADATDTEVLRTHLAAADAVVLTIRADPGSESTLGETTTRVIDVAVASGSRLLVVGGAGPLRSPERPGALVVDDPSYVPPEWRALAVASIEQLRACQRRSDADWTYLSPPALLLPGERTGSYRRGTDTLLVDAGGRSEISAEDLAVAVLDELESPSGLRRMTVAY